MRTALLLAAAALLLPAQSLLPYPRQLTHQPGELHLPAQPTITVNSNDLADFFAAQQLAAELRDIDHLAPRIQKGSGGDIVLTRATLPAVPTASQSEGYKIEVGPRRAVVSATSAAGVFYGVATLRQLFHAGVAPAVTITDWPALRWRAIQIDLSRGPIPSLAAFERDLPLLAELKINALVLYFENTYAYPSLPVWSAPGGAITPGEARTIVADAAKYHITVIPEQEAFGHLHLGLQAERYQDLLETPYGHVLTPTVPASLDFIAKMFADLAPVFPGPFFHIGADETAELGTGRSAALKQSEGPGPLYLNYLKDIDARLQPYHRKILFWGDIAQAHPELLASLPKDMIAVPWDYSPRSNFFKLIQPFTQAGLETWVAPGVNNWNRIFPDYNAALINIHNFVRDGRVLGATGILNTNWDDDGESFFDFAWYGYAYGSAEGWEDTPDDARFQNSYDWAMFRAEGHTFAQQIDQLDQIHATLQAGIQRDGLDSLMWYPAFSEEGMAMYLKMAPSAHQVRLLAEDVIAEMAQHRADAQRNQDLLDPVEFAARRFDWLGEKAIYTKYIHDLYTAASAPTATKSSVRSMFGRINQINGLLQDMRDHATNMAAQYRTLWLESNTPYFLPNIELRYSAEAQYWQLQSHRFDSLESTYSKTGTLPPLTETADATVVR